MTEAAQQAEHDAKCDADSVDDGDHGVLRCSETATPRVRGHDTAPHYAPVSTESSTTSSGSNCGSTQTSEGSPIRQSDLLFSSYAGHVTVRSKNVVYNVKPLSQTHVQMQLNLPYSLKTPTGALNRAQPAARSTSPVGSKATAPWQATISCNKLQWPTRVAE